MKRSPALERRRLLWVLRHLALLRRAGASGTLPLLYWRLAQRAFALLFGSGDVLQPPDLAPVGSQVASTIRRLGFEPEHLGGWALDAHGMALLAGLLERTRPVSVLEFGAGQSTLLFARYAAAQRALGSAVTVITIEQDSAVAEQVRQRLETQGVGGDVVVLDAPLTADGRYDFDLQALRGALRGTPLGLVLVDGPFGPPGCRGATLPAIQPLCTQRTRWVLDDAFRDGELAALRIWQRTPGLEVQGIVPVGRGLALGRVSAALGRNTATDRG